MANPEFGVRLQERGKPYVGGDTGPFSHIVGWAVGRTSIFKTSSNSLAIVSA